MFCLQQAAVGKPVTLGEFDKAKRDIADSLIQQEYLEDYLKRSKKEILELRERLSKLEEENKNLKDKFCL